MAGKKSGKRRHSRTVDLKRQMEREKLADEKDRARKRMDPTARLLLLGDLVFLSVSVILESKELISAFAGGMCTIIGVVLLLTALWFQFGRKKGPNGPGAGPRL